MTLCRTIMKDAATLSKIADQAMTERGFNLDFPPEVMAEIAPLTVSPPPISNFRDLRQLLFFSIDNDDSKDLDQLTYVEKTDSGKDRIYVAIADVDGIVKTGAQTDRYAAHNTTSVYTPAKIFPMLPPKLSTDLTSLNPGSDRSAIVVEMEVADDGLFERVDICPAWVRNHAKLAYNNVAGFLEGKDTLSVKISGLSEQIRLHDAIAQRIKDFRNRQGALSFSTIEVSPVIVDGLALALEVRDQNRAQMIIENFMIAANVTITRYLTELKLPTLRRVVRTPERWDRIVILAETYGEKLPSEPSNKALRDFLVKRRQKDSERFPDLSLAIIKLVGRGEYIASFIGQEAEGHFDLALQDYAHTTAPNRRFPDLIMQRLLKSHFYGTPLPYEKTQLLFLAKHCTEKEDDATKVERHLRKSAAAIVLSRQFGKVFPAMVTGAAPKGTWVRLRSPPIEGRLIKGFEGVDVGDHIQVKLAAVDIAQGFIDFSRVE